MKKLVALMLAMVMGAGLLTACGGSASKSSSAAAGSSSSAKAADSQKKDVALTLGMWNQRQVPAMQALCDEYHKANPNVTITLQSTPSKGNEYWTKLQAAAAGGTAPDIFWMNTVNLLNFVDAGMVLALDDTISQNKIDMTAFPTSLVEMYKVNGKQYAIPKDFDTTAVWYNKEIFDAAKEPYPKAGWTWDDMVAVAQRLTNKASGVYGIAAPLDYQSTYYNTVPAAGGYIINKEGTAVGFDQQATKDGIQCWIDLIQKGVSPDLATLTDTTADTLFESGKLAMVWAGSYMTNEYTTTEGLGAKIDCVELPTFKGKEGNVINGLGYSVYAKSKNAQEAQKFLTWVVSKEGMAVQGKLGLAIAAHKDAQSYFEQAYAKYNMKAYISKASLATPLPRGKKIPQINDIQVKYLKLAWAGTQTLDEACKSITEESNALLK